MYQIVANTIVSENFLITQSLYLQKKMVIVLLLSMKYFLTMINMLNTIKKKTGKKKKHNVKTITF